MDPITQKLMMATGDTGGSQSPYVEDVFCVDTYRGFGAGYDSPFASGLTTNYGKDGYYSTYFPGYGFGNGGFVDASANSGFALGGNFTIEMWVKGPAQSGQGNPSYNRLWQLDGPSGNSDNRNLQMTINPSDQTLHTWCTGSGSGSSIALVGSVNIMDGNWHHVCVERATIGGTTDIITQYVDGVPDGATSQDQNLFNPNNSQPRMRWGAHDSSSGHYTGYISNFRMWIGGSQYVNNQPAGTTFTPPTAPFTNGSFLAFQKSEIYMHDYGQSLTLTAASPNVPKTGRRICENLNFTDGGLLWMKRLNAALGHRLYDTARDIRKVITSDNVTEESEVSGGIAHWTANGASHVKSGEPAYAMLGDENEIDVPYVAWGFKKNKKFFDVIKWDGNNVDGRVINHDLKCEPGVIMVKCLTASYGWQVYHRSLTTTGSNGKDATSWLRLDTDSQASTANTPGFNNVNEQSFEVGSYVGVNATSQSYIAYLFAHDEDPRGCIKCGTYTGNSGVNRVELGWEPQYVMIKRSNGSDSWWIYDSQRDGLRSYNRGSMNQTSPSGSLLYADLPNSTDQTFDILADATGFNLPAVGGGNNGSGDEHVYIAIRRGLTRTPTDPTTVFNVVKGAAPAHPTFHAKFPADATWAKQYGTSGNWKHNTRKQGIVDTQHGSRFEWETNVNPISEADYKGDQMKGAWSTSSTGSDHIGYLMKRAPGFFDVVGYAGDAANEDPSVERSIKHGLGVKPEIIIVRSTGNQTGDSTNQFYNAIKNCGHLPTSAVNAYYAYKNLGGLGSGGEPSWIIGDNAKSRFGSSVDTESEFYVGTHNFTNRTNRSYIAWMWATCPKVSKVGYYQGTGSDLDVPCGFDGEARFVLINKVNQMPWYLYDSVRGITSANESFLNWANSDGESSAVDYIDPLTGGFRVTSEANTTININSEYYSFIAIA